MRGFAVRYTRLQRWDSDNAGNNVAIHDQNDPHLLWSVEADQTKIHAEKRFDVGRFDEVARDLVYPPLFNHWERKECSSSPIQILVSIILPFVEW